MTLILTKRVSQFVFVAVDVLGPILTVFPTVNPAPIVLGLDYKHTIYRYDHMINLCTVSSLLYQQVVDDLVPVFGKESQ